MNKKEIYLAGGCFWGTEKYLKNIRGVIETEVGYANGNTSNPTYVEVCTENTCHAETVKVVYNPEKLTLTVLLDLFYDVINPIVLNRQGNDIGIQYRTGIYFTDAEDEKVINASLKLLQEHYKEKIVVEVRPLENYYKAEEYHQDFLEKNPNGYCHIGEDKIEKVRQR